MKYDHRNALVNLGVAESCIDTAVSDMERVVRELTRANIPESELRFFEELAAATANLHALMNTALEKMPAYADRDDSATESHHRPCCSYEHGYGLGGKCGCKCHAS